MEEDENVYRIADLAVPERSLEQVARLGAQSLSNAAAFALLSRVDDSGKNAVRVG